MKKISLIVILIFIALNTSVAYKSSRKEPLEQKTKENKISDWENPAMIGRNKEAAHCTYTPYADIETALKG
jgi:beta-galactosidase